jgi:hypothetical protein
MSEISLLFEFADHNAAEESTQSIEKCLSALEMVDEVQAVRQGMRMTGLEIAAAVAVTATVARSGADTVENLGKLIAAIRSSIVQLRALKNVFVDVGDQRVPIDQLDAAKLKEMVRH